MIHKAEQDRIKSLLRDTITLLFRNSLSVTQAFSIEALIGITLNKNEIVLVSINENVQPNVPAQAKPADTSSSDEEPLRISEGPSPYHKTNLNHHRRRRRKRPHVKMEPEETPDARHLPPPALHQSHDGLLDLSTEHHAARHHDADSPAPPPPIKRTNSDDDGDPRPEDENRSVIVKKEVTEESWPPAGVLQEVTVGGSDSGNSDQPPYNNNSYTAAPTTSSFLQSMSALNALSPGSSPRAAHLPPLPHMMNGIPFPPLPLPQSHFAQALGRLVGSIPPSLSQKVHHAPSPKEASTPTKTSAGNSSLYHPTSRSSLPKEAVAMMTEWLRENMHNPYPTDEIKDEFVHKTGLTFNQINYWFTNARRRLLPKWEMERNMQEQEMVQQIAQHMGSKGPTADMAQQLAHQQRMGGTPPSTTAASSHKPS